MKKIFLYCTALALLLFCSTAFADLSIDVGNRQANSEKSLPAGDQHQVSTAAQGSSVPEQISTAIQDVKTAPADDPSIQSAVELIDPDHVAENIYQNPVVDQPPVIQDIILNEGFENGGVRPAGWLDHPGTFPWLFNGGTGGSPNPGAPHTGSYAAYFNIYNYSAGTIDSLISPSMDLSVHSGDYILSFWGWDATDPYGYVDSANVWLSESGTLTYLGLLPPITGSWTNFIFSFTSTSTDARIIFVGYSDYGYTDPYIDDVIVADAGANMGRCCYGDPAYPDCADNTQPECDALLGTWSFGQNCTDDPCPSTLGFDCNTPIVVSLPAQMPYADLGQTNCGKLNDYSNSALGYYDGGEDIIYRLDVASTVVVDVTLDPFGTTYTGLLIDDSCPTDSVTYVAKSTISGSGVHALLNKTLDPGTYYIMIDTWPSPNCIPTFDLRITTHVDCVVECPPGATPEGEPVCDSGYVDVTNGGCNWTPNVFGTVSAGETICGESGTYLMGTSQYRDTDWYAITLTERKLLTATGMGEFPFRLILFRAPCPGTQLIYRDVLPCSTNTVSAIADPGEYYVVALPSVFTGVTCGSPYYFTVTVADVPPVIPDFVVTAPGTWSGNTCGGISDCALRPSVDHIYEVTLPSFGMWTFSTCGAASSWDGYMILSSVICADTMAYGDDECTGIAEMMPTFSRMLSAGTYYVTIEGYSSTGCGPYQLDITYEPPPDVICPPGGIAENEPDCGPDYVDAFNGGCNSDPPVFSPISIDNTVCGEGGTFTSALGDSRDTDWYLLDLQTAQILTWKGVAEFPLQLFIMDAGCDYCGDEITLASGSAAAGDTVTLTATAGPGNIYLWAGPSVFTGYPCPLEYVAILTATPAPACVPDFNVTAPGFWTGTTCGAGNDVNLRPSADHLYEVVIPTAGRWTFATCGGDTAWDGYLYLGSACGEGDIAYDDDSCDLPNGMMSTFATNLLAGTYYVTVEGFSASYCGGYQLDISYEPPPFDLTCPPGAIPENEPDCGHCYVDNYNGGCNSTPHVFQEVNAGDVYCGTTGTFDNQRDTDWYRLVLDNPSVVTLKGVAECQIQLLVIDAGIEDCITTPILGSGSGEPGDTVIVTASAGPGVVYLWAGPSVFAGWPCPSEYAIWIAAGTPQAQIDTSPITHDVVVGDTAIYQRTLSNIGDAPLQYSVSLSSAGLAANVVDNGVKVDPVTTDRSPNAGNANPPTITAFSDLIYNFDVQNPTGYDGLLGVEFDGTNFWVSGRNSVTSEFGLHQFDHDGNYLATYPQTTNSAWGLRDLAFDGSRIYGGDDYVIYGFDIVTGEKIDSIPKPPSAAVVRALAYDPVSDHFFTANWNSNIIEFDRTGTEINYYTNTYQVYGLAYDAVTPGGPYLWAFSQDGALLCQVSQFDIASGAYTGIYFDAVLPTGYTAAMAGGICFTTEWNPLVTAVFVVGQGTPTDYVAGYEISMAGWITVVENGSGTIDPGSSVDIKFKIDFTDPSVVLDSTYQADATVNNNGSGLPPVIHFAITAIEQPSGCSYIPGDINNFGGANGIDVTFGVSYFKGGLEPPIDCNPPCTLIPDGPDPGTDPDPAPDPFFAAGDVNGNCQFNGIDVTYFVAYLKEQQPALLYCPTCPPASGVAPAIQGPSIKAKAIKGGNIE